MTAGKIFVVATPIGNLADMSPRAQQVLREVECIAAEDTRHSKKLLAHFGIATPLVAYHQHNETTQSLKLLENVQQGQCLALISDAGTPLISDPGYNLIHHARQQGIEVLVIPGPCAAIAALSIAGVDSHKFLFQGFLPAKAQAKRQCLEAAAKLTVTQVFYESTHRIMATLQLLTEVIAHRPLVLARELTKTFETVLTGTAAELLDILTQQPQQQKGEFVLILASAPPTTEPTREVLSIELETLLTHLLAVLPFKQAVQLAVNITGGRKNQLYERALQIKESAGE